MVAKGAPNGGTGLSWLDYRDYRDRLTGLSGLAIHRQCAFTLGDGQPARLTWGELVSGNYFDVMGVKPSLGRVFTREESADSLGAYPVAVISARLWRSYFHSDPRIVGKTMRVNRHSLTIVGVVPAEFRGTSPVMQYDFWAPVTMAVTLGSLPESAFSDRGYRGMLDAICRRRAGVSIAQARAEAMALAASLAAANPITNRAVGATILPTWEQHNGVNELLRAPLGILLGVFVRGAADRVRQRRESPAGARGRAAERVRHSLRARRGTLARRRTGAHGDAGAGRRGRRCGPADAAVDAGVAARHGAERRIPDQHVTTH